MFIRIEYFVCR